MIAFLHTGRPWTRRSYRLSRPDGRRRKRCEKSISALDIFTAKTFLLTFLLWNTLTC